MTTKVVGYSRVSTEEQAKEGVSLAAQRSRIISYCMAKGWSLTKIYTDDGVSGRNLDRLGLQELIEDIRGDGIEAIVVVKLDRLVRSVRYLGELVDDLFNGLSLTAIEEGFDSSNAAGRMMMNVLGSLGQWEREVISERTKTALQHKKEQGEWVGRPPYGYVIKNKRLVEEPEQQRIIRAIRQSYGAGHLSMMKLAVKYGIADATVFKIVHMDRRSRQWRDKTGR